MNSFYFCDMLLSFIIKYFLNNIYNYCDESMYAHSSIKYFGLYNFADFIIFLVQLLVHYNMM